MPNNSSPSSELMAKPAATLAAISRASWAGAAKKAFPTVILGLLVYFAVFRLPFRFPPQVRLMSASYTFGFNNSVAILALVALLGLATLLQLLRRQANEPLITFASPDAAGARRAIRIAFVVLALFYAALTWALYLYDKQSEPSLMWETRHLLHRAWVMDVYKLRPYTEIAAEYGPILTYAPLYVYWLLKPLGTSHLQAYFVSHLILNLGGLWCAYYIVSRVVVLNSARVIAFIVIAVSGFGPYMGINGVLLRYLFPFATLLLAHRLVTRALSFSHQQARWPTAVATVMLLLSANILVSPEVGIAFALAWMAYAGLSARSDLRILAVSLIGVLATTFLCWLSLPAAYYGSLLRFSEGANNLPLLPAAHLLLYISSLFLVVPRLLAASLRRPRSGDGPDPAIGAAFAGLCVVMAPGALGRCDPPHVLFYGMGLAILVMIALANISRRAFAIYVSAYVGVFIILMQLVNLRVFYGISPRSLLAHPVASFANALPGTVGTEHPSMATLSALDRYPQLGLPYASFGDPAVERYVISRGQLHPEYYVAIVGVYDAAALERKLSDVAKMDYLLVPNRFVTRSAPHVCSEHLVSLRRWFFYPAKLPCRFDPLDPAKSLNAFIADHYATVQEVGSWSVLRRIGTASSMSNEQ
jgi:hypothetical protein